MRSLTCLLFVAAVCRISTGCLHGNVVTIQGNQILQDDKPIKLVGLRCSNALISDRTADQLMGSLDRYQGYGLNAISVFLMGSRFGDAQGYHPDGSMAPEYLDRLDRILDATRSRDMVVIVGCLYWSTSLAKADLMEWNQEDANRAIAGTAKWLGEAGYRHVILDPDNEGMAGREMEWETESMVLAAKAANPLLPVANNTHKPAPSADLNIHFGPRDPAKPYLDSESTPAQSPFKNYWGQFSKETHQKDSSYYNYSRIGRYTQEMKQSQFEITRDLIENYNGILFASTWIQCGPGEGVSGPMTDPGGYSDLGSGADLTAPWNRDIDVIHPDAGIRWWLEFVRDTAFRKR